MVVEPLGECTSVRVLSFLHLLGPVVVAALTSHYAHAWLFCIVSSPGHSVVTMIMVMVVVKEGVQCYNVAF